jgi:hypothetical protein
MDQNVDHRPSQFHPATVAASRGISPSRIFAKALATSNASSARRTRSDPPADEVSVNPTTARDVPFRASDVTPLGHIRG